jgi:hypothetical protein
MRNFGLRALSLSEVVRHEAQRSMDLLTPYDKSLLEATRFYIAHLERTSRSAPAGAHQPELHVGGTNQEVRRA